VALLGVVYPMRVGGTRDPDSSSWSRFSRCLLTILHCAVALAFVSSASSIDEIRA